MQFPCERPFGAIFVCCAALLGLPAPARAQAAADPAPLAEPTPPDTGHWRVLLSPYTYHWQYNPQHRPVHAIALEWQRPDGWLLGGSSFSNSFGQPSAYLYAGRHWDGVLGVQPLFTELTGGLLYGYRGEFKNKVPFNHNGYSPGAVVIVGWHLDRHSSVAVDLLGASAVMFQYSYDFH